MEPPKLQERKPSTSNFQRSTSSGLNKKPPPPPPSRSARKASAASKLPPPPPTRTIPPPSRAVPSVTNQTPATISPLDQKFKFETNLPEPRQFKPQRMTFKSGNSHGMSLFEKNSETLRTTRGPPPPVPTKSRRPLPQNTDNNSQKESSAHKEFIEKEKNNLERLMSEAIAKQEFEKCVRYKELITTMDSLSLRIQNGEQVQDQVLLLKKELQQ